MSIEEIALVRNLVAYERFLEDLVRLLEEGKVPDTFMSPDIEISKKMRRVAGMICGYMDITPEIGVPDCLDDDFGDDEWE